jgi:hypothetical protein
MDVYRAKVKHTEWMAGLLLSTIVNWSMHPPEEPRMPKDFPLELLRVPEKRKRINRKQIAAQIRAEFDGAMAAQKSRRFQPPS